MPEIAQSIFICVRSTSESETLSHIRNAYQTMQPDAHSHINSREVKELSADRPVLSSIVFDARFTVHDSF